MSLEDREDCDQWQPTISEIADLLQQLRLSPPHSEDDIASLNDNASLGSKNNQTESDESSRNSTIFGDIDRDEILEKLEIIRGDKIINKIKNNWFHEYLVEHFTRKQMIHVCSDKSEDEALLQEYLKKLRKLYRHNEKIRSNEDMWNEELSIMRMEVAEKNKSADEIIKSMILVEQGIKISGVRHKRLASTRKIEALISKQIERIDKVSHFRLSYLKIRNKFIMIDNNLQSLTSSGPNLSRDDYEKLEAEQYYYQQQLNLKNAHCINLLNKKDYLINKLKSLNLKILQINKNIKIEKKIILDLRIIMKKYLNKNRILMNKINYNNKIISDYTETVLRLRTKQFNLNIEKNNKNYEDWMKKISKTLKQMKRLGQSLSALRANLILHGKKIELSNNDDVEIFEKIVDKSLDRKSPYQ